MCGIAGIVVRKNGLEIAAVEEAIETVGSGPVETHGRNICRAVLRARFIAQDELGAGVAQDEINRWARKLEADRNRDEAGAHDPVVGREIFGAVGGEDGNAIPACEPTSTKRAGDAVRHRVKAGVADLANTLAAEVDDRHLVEILIATNEVTEIGEARHGSHGPFGGAVR